MYDEYDLTPELAKNLDGLIDQWSPDIRGQWEAEGKLGPNDFKGMFRTAIITISRVREAKAAAERSHAVNALYGNVSPDMEGKSIGELEANSNSNAVEEIV